MENLLTFAILGIGTGALYGLAAQGMVIIYRGSGVINFAHGAMALLSAAIFVGLRNHTAIPLSLIIGLSVASSALCGFLIDFLIMRRIRSASPLARLIVTLAVLAIIESLVVVFSGSHLRFVEGFLPTTAIKLGGLTLSSDRLIILGIAIVITFTLWWLYRYTDFGRQTTAVAENPRSAAALGISTNRISEINWALGAALAGLTGILIAPLTGLLAATLVLLINPVLAAALVGRFSSFPLTLIGGLLIGIIQSLVNYSDLGAGWSSAVPFLIIISLLVLRGQALPLRGYIADRLPSVAKPFSLQAGLTAKLAIKISLIAAAIFLTIFVSGDDLLAALTSSMLAAVVLLSIVVLTGMAGQVSLGQYAFVGIGAFISARLADVWQWPFSLSFAAAICIALLSSVVFALPALRTRGVNLAIATLGLGLAIDALIFKNKDLTGGFAGTVVDPPTLFGISFDAIYFPQRYALLVLAFLAVGCWLVVALRTNASGRRLLATRANERAAAAMGINVVSTKLYAFAIAATIAASAGVLMAFRYPNVRFDVGYSAFESIPAVLMAFLGGIGFVTGALLGGLMSMGGVVNELLSRFIELNEWMGCAIGLGAIMMVLGKPNGLVAGSTSNNNQANQNAQRHVAPPNAPATVQQELPSNIQRQSSTLQLHHAGVQFGGVQALQNVGIEVISGKVHGLIGPNGAGKTTLLDALSGFTALTSGSISFDQHDISGYSASARANLGISRSFQSLELFDDLTVEEHLRCASEQADTKRYLGDLFWPTQSTLPDTALRAAQLFGLDQLLDHLPAQLSFGQRRLLGIARAVAAKPRILLLDEPAAGLDSNESQQLGELIRQLACDWGIGILLIEHDIHLVMQRSDTITVLDFGQVIASGTPEYVAKHPDVIDAYLGKSPAGKGTVIETSSAEASRRAEGSNFAEGSRCAEGSNFAEGSDKSEHRL